jgi:predicted ester cyclase
MSRATRFDLTLALCLSVLGCSSRSSTPAGASAASGGEQAKLAGADLVQRYGECWNFINTKQWEQFGQCYAPDAVSTWLDSGMPQATSRADIIEKQAKPFMAAFPDWAGERQLTLANGRTVLSLALTRGTHEGVLMTPNGPIQPTHKKIGVLVAHMVEFNDAGQVQKEWFAQDMGTMLAQLGLSPAPARAADAPDWAVKPVVVATGSDTERSNAVGARALDDKFSAHDKTMLDLCTENVVDHNPSFPQDLAGRAALSQLMDGFWTGFPDITAHVSNVWAAGDYTVSVFDFGGTNSGPMPAFGLAQPTGKRFALNVIEIDKWENGKVTDIWPMFNGAAIAGQLGLVPPAK